MTGTLPLDGPRVLELGHIVAGPSAGLLFADLGADVIKVEWPGDGDQSRTMPAGTSALFHFVLAVLQQRARTGAGQKITSGLYETCVFWVGQWIAQHAATGEPSIPLPEMTQGTRMGWGVYQLFTAADGEEIFIGITSNAHRERFCKEFKLDDLLADARLDDNAKRVAARGWLPARIAEEMLRYSSAELSAAPLWS